MRYNPKVHYEMLRCPVCERNYADETLNFCLEDGTRLVANSFDDAPTAIFSDSGQFSENIDQDIRFCTTADGVRIAYSAVGSGPVLVRVLGHFTHLEIEWAWPNLRHFWEELAKHFTVVRYDGRGIGLSDKFEGEFTEEGRQLDLDAVLRNFENKQVILLGISEGGWTAAKYVIEHPGAVEPTGSIWILLSRGEGPAGL